MERLIFQSGEAAQGEVLLNADILLVGRGHECQIRIPTKEISRFHARLERLPDGSLRVEDLNSSNGTFVNGIRISEPTRIAAGDSLRFANSLAVLEPAQREARVGSERRRLRLRQLLAASLILVGVVTVLFLAWDDLLPGEPATPSRDDDAVADEAGTPSGEEPTEELAPDPEEAVTQPQIAAPDPSRPQPDDTSTVVLRDGSRIEVVVKKKSAAWLVVVPVDRGTERRISLERVVSIDGASPVFVALDAYAERRSEVTDEKELMALAEWCRKHALEEQGRSIARRVLSMFPNHPEARAALGEHLYRGNWKTSEELQSLGALGPEGRLEGSDGDLRQIRRWCFVLLGRPPLRKEMAGFLAMNRRDLRQHLLLSQEAWYWWSLSELSNLFRGQDLAAAETLLRKNAAALNDGSGRYRDLFLGALEPKRLEQAGVDTGATVEVVLRALLGIDPGADRRLVDAATRMWKGERVPVFGERGAGVEDLARILTRQPAFYRRRLEHLAQLLFRRLPERKELVRKAFAVAADPAAFAELRVEWATRALPLRLDTVPRRKSTAQFVGGLYVDALDRVPTASERAEGLRLMWELGDREIAQGLLVRAALGGPEPPQANRHASTPGTVRSIFRQVHGRTPQPDELAAGRRLLTDRDCSRLLRVLLSSGEYAWF